MGKAFYGNYETETHNLDVLLLGNNQFETAVLALSSGESAQTGSVLEMDYSNGSYKLAGATPKGALGVLVSNEKYTQAGNIAVRVCISGQVNRDLLDWAGNAPTDEQAAALRDYAIFAKNVVKTN